MGDYFTNLLTVTEADFAKASPRRWGGLGSDSSQLNAVKAALTKHWQGPSRTTFNDLKIVVTNWKAQKPSEFTNRDKLSDGVCTRLYEDTRLEPRNRGVRSVILHGEKRVAADGFPTPFVQQEDLDVVSLMTHAHASGQGLGVIVVDLYGNDFRSQGMDRRYDGGQTVLENMRDVLDFARKERLTTINFTMASKQTVPEISQKLPNNTIHCEKASHNSFKGTDLDQLMQQSGCRYWVVFGFNANQCVAATIFGSRDGKLLRVEKKRRPEDGMMMEKPVFSWLPGVLDRGYNVITSRLILASHSGSPLQSSEGWPYLGPSNWG